MKKWLALTLAMIASITVANSPSVLVNSTLVSPSLDKILAMLRELNVRKNAMINAATTIHAKHNALNNTTTVSLFSAKLKALISETNAINFAEKSAIPKVIVAYRIVEVSIRLAFLQMEVKRCA